MSEKTNNSQNKANSKRLPLSTQILFSLLLGAVAGFFFGVRVQIGTIVVKEVAPEIWTSR